MNAKTLFLTALIVAFPSLASAEDRSPVRKQEKPIEATKPTATTGASPEQPVTEEEIHRFDN